MTDGIIQQEILKKISMLDRYAQFTKNDVELHLNLLQQELIEKINEWLESYPTYKNDFTRTMIKRHLIGDTE